MTAIAETGYEIPTLIQQQAIPLIKAHHDVMARAQTGTGKTAAFALPLLDNLLVAKAKLNRLSILVLVPTRELAQQVHQSFCRYSKHTSITAAVVYGGVSLNNQISVLSEGVNILVATPGRLIDLVINEHVDLSTINTVVLDEADRLLDLGFKPDIDKLREYLPAKHQSLLFSATFDDKIFNLSKSLLTDPKIVSIESTNTVANHVEQIIYTLDKEKKREFISYLIGSKNWQQVLIFTRTKISADKLAKEMAKDGIKTLALHGDKSQGAREKALAEFKQGKCRALVATDVAARGLDIVDLQYIINYELPYVAEDYVHRVGRTARAGKAGKAISLLSPDEEWLLQAIEELLDCRLLQQWYPGYEPNLEKVITTQKPNNKKKIRKHAFNKAKKLK